MLYRPGVSVDSDLSLEFERMNDGELVDRIENAAEIKELERSKGWRLISEACKRAANQARESLADVDPENKVLIVKYQQIAKLYGNVIPSLVNSFKQEGEMAFEEAKGRGVLDRLLSKVRA